MEITSCCNDKIINAFLKNGNYPLLETYNETKMVMLPTGNMFIWEVYIMKLQYRIKNNHIEILRCYGTDSQVSCENVGTCFNGNLQYSKNTLE